MKIKPIWESVKRYCVNNQSKLCTIGACVGLTGTMVLSFVAGMKARRKIDQLVEENPEPKVLDVIKVTWKDCIWAVAAYLSTGTLIILGHSVDAKTIAGLKAALDISEATIIAGKEELVAQLGEEKAKEIQNDINNRMAEKNPPTDANTITVNQDRPGYTLIRDSVTGEYFWDDIERLKVCIERANDLFEQRERAFEEGYTREVPHLTYNEILALQGRQEIEGGDVLGTYKRLELNTNCSGVCPENGLYPGHVYWSLTFWDYMEALNSY